MLFSRTADEKTSTLCRWWGEKRGKKKREDSFEDSHRLSRRNRTKIIAKPWRGTMLACVYPAENFKSKAVTVKLRHGRSKRKPKLLSVKEKLADGRQPECNDTAPKLENEVSFPLFVTFLRSLLFFPSSRVLPPPPPPPLVYRCTLQKSSTSSPSL